MQVIGKLLGQILLTALAIIISAYFIKGVQIANYSTAVIVAIVLAFLNAFLKPVLVLLTLPATIFSFGLFLLVINMVVIKLAANIVHGFTVQNWWSAFWFSIVLSLVTALLDGFLGNKKQADN